MPSRRELMGAAAALGLTRAGTGTAAPAPLRIWNLHCHLYGLPGATGRERVASALRFADRLGIDRLIFYMGMTLGTTHPAPEDIRRFNDECMEAIRPFHPRVLGFVYVNPQHTETCVQEIDRCVRDGPLVGVKLHVSVRCRDPLLDPIVKRATELRAPVYQHTFMKVTGNPDGESTPADLALLAARHPRASLICGHAGGDWELGVRTVRATKNLSLELAGFDPAAGVVEMAVRELGPERVIYGSDTGGRSFASQLGKVMGADVSDGTRRLILGGNLRRLLEPIMRAKGIAAT